MKFTSIPLSFDELPVQKTITLNGQDYILEAEWNDVGEFCVLTFRNLSYEVLFITKIVYGNSVMPFEIGGLPFEVVLIPANLDDLYSDSITERITPSNLGTSVELFVGKRNE